MPYLSDSFIWSTGREDVKVSGYGVAVCLLDAIPQADLLAQCKVQCEGNPSCKSIELKTFNSMSCCMNSITYSEAVDAGVATDANGFIYYDFEIRRYLLDTIAQKTIKRAR